MRFCKELSSNKIFSTIHDRCEPNPYFIYFKYANVPASGSQSSLSPFFAQGARVPQPGWPRAQGTPAAEAPAAGRAAAAASATWTPMGSATRSARGLEGRRPTAGARVCKTADVSIARSDAGVSKPRTCGRGGAPRRPRPLPLAGPRAASVRTRRSLRRRPRWPPGPPPTPTPGPLPRTFPRVTHV